MCWSETAAIKRSKLSVEHAQSFAYDKIRNQSAPQKYNPVTNESAPKTNQMSSIRRWKCWNKRAGCAAQLPHVEGELLPLWWIWCDGGVFSKQNLTLNCFYFYWDHKHGTLMLAIWNGFDWNILS